MRLGLLSDEYIRAVNPAFFPEAKHKSLRRTILHKKTILPYYDIFSVAQVTLQNPFEEIPEILSNLIDPNHFPDFFDNTSIPNTPNTSFSPYEPYIPFSPPTYGGGTLDDDDLPLAQYGTNFEPVTVTPQEKKVANALKKLQIDAIGTSVGGTPNNYTQTKDMLLDD